jgi:hypothetical protein
MHLVPLIIAVSTLAVPDSGRRPEEDPGVWLAELPAGFTQQPAQVSIEVHGCTFSAGYAVEAPPFPPINHVWLRKECENGGYALLGTSFSIPSILLDGKKQQGVIATFTFKDSPSGASSVRAAVVGVDFETGEITHSSVLAAMPPLGRTGVVEPTSVDVKGNGTVVVRGRKTGLLGDVGEGDQFIAIFDKFFKNPTFNPAPSFVIAF